MRGTGNFNLINIRSKSCKVSQVSFYSNGNHIYSKYCVGRLFGFTWAHEALMINKAMFSWTQLLTALIK